jgi:hypothetical protein
MDGGRELRDREMDILSSSSSSDSSDSDNSEDSEALEDSEDRQFRREMDDYDRHMARAHEIAERVRQRQELESDSELSELASSEFNGMEGIEMGGTETGGDSEAQVPVYSPRKTGSGRVIKCVPVQS